MTIGDELHERVFSLKFDYLNDEEAQKIATLVKKSSVSTNSAESKVVS